LALGPAALCGEGRIKLHPFTSPLSSILFLLAFLHWTCHPSIPYPYISITITLTTGTTIDPERKLLPSAGQLKDSREWELAIIEWTEWGWGLGGHKMVNG
jgi:hypothetical protein